MEWQVVVSLPRKLHPTAHPSSEVVFTACCRVHDDRCAAVRLYFHGDVLRVHVLLELQILLRLRLHAARVHHPRHCHVMVRRHVVLATLALAISLGVPAWLQPLRLSAVAVFSGPASLFFMAA